MGYIMKNITNLEPNDQITKRIEDAKAAVKQMLVTYSDAVKKLRDALKVKLDREAKAQKKQNENTAKALAAATEKYDECYEAASLINRELAAAVSALSADYEKLIGQIEILDPKAVAKKEKEYSAYIAEYEAQKQKIDDIVGAAGVTFECVEEEPVEASEEEEVAEEEAPAEEAPVEEEPAAEEAPAEEAPKEEIAAPAYRGGVNLAPVNIDISSTVEKAVKQAMDKFTASLEYRIDEYFESYVPNVPALGVASGSGISSEGVELQAKVAEDEEALIDKLVGLVETLKNLNNAMATVTATYAQLDARFKEAVDLQRQTNDMMRHTMREQQGVQVNQRVISKDQLSITEEQTALIDAQKAALEAQKQVSAAQMDLAETQKSIVETHNSIEDAMKAVMQEQKRMISAQQSIIAENEKSAKNQEAIAQKQTEITEAQKELLTSQKQVLKEQKATNDRQKEAVETQKTVNAEVKEVLKEQKSVAAKVPAKKA